MRPAFSQGTATVATAGRSLHAKGISVKEVRCGNCNKKLAEADYSRLVIKCPRCGVMNNLKAVEPPDRAPSALKVRADDPDP